MKNDLSQAIFYLDLDHGHEKKLTKHSTRSEVHQQFFSNRVVNDWNGLDSTVAMAPSLDTVRKCLELSQK